MKTRISFFALVAVSCFIIFGMTYEVFLGSVNLTSDSLFLEELLHKVIQHETSFSSWRLTTAPAYPDILFYSIASIFTESVKQKIALTASLQAVSLVLVGYFYLRSSQQLTKFKAFQISVLVTLWLAFVSGLSNLWLFFQSTNNHFSTVILGFISLIIYEKFSKNHQTVYLGILSLVTIAGLLSSSIHLIAVVIPLVIMSLLSGGTKKSTKPQWIERVGFASTLLFSSVVYLATRGFIIHNDALSGRVKPSVEAAKNSLSWYWNALVEIFQVGNLAILLTFIFAFTFIVIGVASVKEIPGLPKPRILSWVRENFYSTFGLTCLAVTLIASILSGGVADSFAFRYLAFPLLVITFNSISRLYQIKPRSIVNSSAAAFCLILIAMLQLNVVRASSGDQGLPKDSAANCVNEAEKIFNLDNGVANYWDARLTEFELNWRHKVIPTLNNLEPFFWMSSSQELTRATSKPVNFLIVRPDSDPGPFQFDAKTLSQNSPKPDDVYDCQKSNLTLWIYKSDSLTEVLKTKTSQVLWRETGADRIDIYAKDMLTQVGKKSGQKSLLTTNSEGWLTFGPYYPLPSGHYRLRVYGKYEGDKSTAATLEIGKFDVLTNQKLLKKATLVLDDGYTTIDFFNPTLIDKFEMRTWVSSDTKLSLERFDLNRQ